MRWSRQYSRNDGLAYLNVLLTRTSTTELDIDSTLHHEPPTVHCPFRVRISELQIVMPEERWYQFRPESDVSVGCDRNNPRALTSPSN